MTLRTLVAVVDDDESVRESLPDLLRSYGFSASAFASGEDFLASGAPDRADCVILDIGMPGMSGQDLYRELRRQTCNVPVIFITSSEGTEVRASVMEMGAAAFLAKPFDPGALVDALEAALRGR